jgi:hypothetical protein
VAPTITAQPANQTVTVGQTATFAVAASGTAPLSYQWQKNGANIAGATAASYTTPATTTLDNGAAFIVVVSNSAGNAASNPATLMVTADTTPPEVSITSPTSGATVSGTITITASASDNVAVASVQLQVDGANVGAADTNSPYNFSLNTTTLSNGSHTLTAVAVDTLRNQTTSAAVAVTVSNSVSTGTPGPLAVCTSNPRYFCDPSGNVVYLAGDHTWPNIQDEGDLTTPAPFDFNAYMAFARAHGYSYMRLWEFNFSNIANANSVPFVGPVWPWKRVGPGTGNDGLPKTDFTQLDQNYFDRLRARVIQAGQNGLYVSVMLFDGSEFNGAINSIDGNPYEFGNNVNAVNCAGTCPNTLSGMPANVLSFQQAYVKKVVDTVHDLPNAMYEIANEADASYSTAWQQNWITFINNYEKTTYNTHHPVGFTFQYPSGTDQTLYDSAADWVAIGNGGQGATPPLATGQCPVVTGNGGVANPSSLNCKVVINDTDHSFGWISLQAAGATRQINWVWENFTNGNGVAYMDPYLMPWPTRNLCTGAPVDGDNGVCSGLDTQWNQLRSAIGDIVAYGKKIDLKNMTPQDSLSTSGFCLASLGSQYLVFSTTNSFTLTTAPGTYTFEWFNPSTHTIVQTGPVTVGSTQMFTDSFSRHSCLWL